MSANERPTGYVAEDYSATVTICPRRDHDFAEGDEGAIFCTACTGYRCGTCRGGGRVNRGLGTKRCYSCGGYGVEMGWHEWPYRLNPWNWAEATRKAAEAQGA